MIGRASAREAPDSPPLCIACQCAMRWYGGMRWPRAPPKQWDRFWASASSARRCAVGRARPCGWPSLRGWRLARTTAPPFPNAAALRFLALRLSCLDRLACQEGQTMQGHQQRTRDNDLSFVLYARRRSRLSVRKALRVCASVEQQARFAQPRFCLVFLIYCCHLSSSSWRRAR